MEKKYYEILLRYDDLSKGVNEFTNFLKVVYSRFYPDNADEIAVYVSKEKRTVFLLIKFDFKKFLPSYFVWFNNWSLKLNIKIIDFMKLEKEKRDEILKEILDLSDQKFVTPFDLEPVQKFIKSALSDFEDKRSDERFRAEIKVKFKNPSDFLRKYTEDISKGGIFVKAFSPLPINTPVKVVLMLPQTEEIELPGEVVYVLKEDEAKMIGRNPGMGIKFTEVTPEASRKLDELIERIKAKISLNYEEKRRDERVVAEIKIKFKATDEFVQEFAEDISKGGVFIKTNKPLPFDTPVRVLIEFPDTTQIELDGKVVYVLKEEDAKAMLRSPGMGIQFVNISESDRAKLERFIEEIKEMKLNGKGKRS